MRPFKLYLLFLGFVALNRQNGSNFPKYYELVNAGKDKFDSLDYSKSSFFYETAFSTVDTPYPKDLIKASYVELLNGNNTKAAKYLIRAADLGEIAPDSILTKVDGKEYQLSMRLTTLKLKFTEKLNHEYIKLIDSLYERDQSIRLTKPRKEWRGIDSSNIYTLLLNIDKFGFPNFKNVGRQSAERGIIILLHADFDINNKVLGEILLNAVTHGNLSPSTYAQIMDRRANFSGRPMVYYEIPFGYDDLDKAQKDSITIRRQNIGLRSVDKSIEYKFLPNGTLRTRIKE